MQVRCEAWVESGSLWAVYYVWMLGFEHFNGRGDLCIGSSIGAQGDSVLVVGVGEKESIKSYITLWRQGRKPTGRKSGPETHRLSPKPKSHTTLTIDMDSDDSLALFLTATASRPSSLATVFPEIIYCVIILPIFFHFHDSSVITPR